MEFTVILSDKVAKLFKEHLAQIQQELPCDEQRLAAWAINYYLEKEANRPYPYVVERDDNDEEYGEFYDSVVEMEGQS